MAPRPKKKVVKKAKRKSAKRAKRLEVVDIMPEKAVKTLDSADVWRIVRWPLVLVGVLTLIFLVYVVSNNEPEFAHEVEQDEAVVVPPQPAPTQQQSTNTNNYNTNNYSSNNLQGAIVNAMGTQGAFIAEWMDMIVLLIVLGFIVGVLSRLSNLFR